MPIVACNALSTGLVRKPPAMPIIAAMGSLARAIAAATAPLSKAGTAAGFGSAWRPRSRLLERRSPRRSRPREELRRRRSRSRRSREELRPRAWCRSCPRSRGDGLRRRRSRWSRRSRSLSRLSRSRSRSLSLSRSRSLSLSLSLTSRPSPLSSLAPPSALVSEDPPPCSKALPPIRGGVCWGVFLLPCCDSKRSRSACSDEPPCSDTASPPVGATTPQETSVPRGVGTGEGAPSWGAFELTSASTMSPSLWWRFASRNVRRLARRWHDDGHGDEQGLLWVQYHPCVAPKSSVRGRASSVWQAYCINSINS